MTTSIATVNGDTTRLRNGLLQAFRDRVRGPVLTEADDTYDQARLLFNGMIDKRPALIVRCTGLADVIHTVRLAREHDLLLAVRGGGHGVAGNAVCDGGLMLDLSLMRSVQVDPAARVARVQGGATLRDLDWETQPFALVAPAGVVSTTGVAGLTLGGGYGWVRGKYGMTVDNLLAVEIVTAEGERLQASETENPDLFWAVRGGGGNFGVATNFTFRLHPLGPIVFHCGPMYAGEVAREILVGWRAFMVDAPDDVTTEFFFWTIPSHPSFPSEMHGRHVVIPSALYAGPADEGERVLQPLRELAGPLLDLSARRPFLEVQQMFDPYLPTGELLHYWKALYLDRWNDEVVHALVMAFNQRPPGVTRTPFVLHDLRGASSRVLSDATAFSNRTKPYLIEFNSTWTNPADTDRNVAWTRQVWTDMRQRFSPSGAGYLNMDCYNEDGEPLVHTTFGTKYERLRQVKKKYDPTNFFRLNMNIEPAT
jgi:FAD/FMN-containing dehydrogenase